MYQVLYFCVGCFCLYLFLTGIVKLVEKLEKNEIMKARIKLTYLGCPSAMSTLLAITRTFPPGYFITIESIHIVRCEGILEFGEHWPLLSGTESDLEELVAKGDLEKEIRTSKASPLGVTAYRLKEKPVLKLVA